MKPFQDRQEQVLPCKKIGFVEFDRDEVIDVLNGKMMRRI